MLWFGLVLSSIVTVFGHGLDDIEHVILFMQENRAFDHYFATMAGVRGYKDPNVLIREDGKPVWYQKAANGSELLPFYLVPEESYRNSTQCIIAGSNEWTVNHVSWNNGKVDQWTANTPWAWGSLRRRDLATHFDIAEGWTIADMYAESVIGPTGPNRVVWTSGTINVPGSPAGDPFKMGGPYIENWHTEGCTSYPDGQKANCFPLKWKTVPEYLSDSGISWFLYEEKDNFADNPFPWFENFRGRDDDHRHLRDNALSTIGLQAFFDHAEKGTLPQVSYVVSPMEISEHPPNLPNAGAWLQKRVVDAVTRSPKYNKTALIISYDETGGFGDHVPPFVSSNGTKGEWFVNPEDKNQFVPSGPGFRVPMYIVSPWTRGGHVFTAPSDHNSQIMFLEKWAEAALKKNITSNELNHWRRNHMSDLVDMFDFEHPDYTLPKISNKYNPTNYKEAMKAAHVCQEKYYHKLKAGRPPVPWENTDLKKALWTEQGFKQLRGQLTEGRYLVFRSRKNESLCLTAGDNLKLDECSKDFSDRRQRFFVKQQGNAFSHDFQLKSVISGFLTNSMGFKAGKGDTFTIIYDKENGYGIVTKKSQPVKNANHDVSCIKKDAKKSDGAVSLDNDKYFDLFSVTYDDE